MHFYGLESTSAIEPHASWFGDFLVYEPSVVRSVSAVEGRWALTSFVVDCQEQLASDGGIPLEAFSHALSVLPRMIIVRRRLVVALRNLDDTSKRFAGAVGCSSVAKEAKERGR